MFEQVDIKVAIYWQDNDFGTIIYFLLKEEKHVVCILNRFTGVFFGFFFLLQNLITDTVFFLGSKKKKGEKTYV